LAGFKTRAPSRSTHIAAVDRALRIAGKKASEEQIAQSGIPRSTVHNIREFRDFPPIGKELCELPRINAQLIKWNGPGYPVNLRHIAAPPPYFLIRGTIAADDPKFVAVVGVRAASDAGRRMARRLGLELAAKGYTVVGGLARGIDSEAHQGALDGGGRTVAVMGHAIDRRVPPQTDRRDNRGWRSPDFRASSRHATDRREFSGT
jgi:DNA processing protein